jgi:hypothetical protein
MISVNNSSKIIRSANSFYSLPQQELVVSFVMGSNILTKNLKDNNTKTIQEKVTEQQNEN